MNITDKNTTDSGLISLPLAGNTRILGMKSEVTDNLTGINFYWLMRNALVLKKIPKRREVVRGDIKDTPPVPNYIKYSGKPYTYLFNKYCVRGPYLKVDNNSQYPNAIHNVLNKSVVFDRLPLSYVLTPLAILQEDNMYFMVYSNVYAGIQLEYFTHYELKTGYQYSIVKPNTIITLEEALVNRKTINDMIPTLLRDLIVLYSMEVGGITSDNILVGKSRMYIINIEGITTNIAREDFNNNNRLFYISKISNNASDILLQVNKLFYAEVNGVLNKWMQPLATEYPSIVDRLSYSIAIINNLITYDGSDLTVIVSNSAPISVKGTYYYSTNTLGTPIVDQIVKISDNRTRTHVPSLMSISTSSYQLPQKTKVTPIYSTNFHGEVWRDNDEPVRYDSIDNLNIVAQSVPFTTYVTDQQVITVKSNKVYGPRGGMNAPEGEVIKNITTYSAGMQQYNDYIPPLLYNVNTMSHAVKFYIRSQNLDKTLFAAAELWRLHEIGYRNGVDILLNTMEEVALEIVGVANTNIVYTTIFYCEFWRQTLKTNNSKPVDELVDFYQVCYQLSRLVESPKTMLTIYLYNVYSKGIQYARDKIISPDNSEVIYNQLSDDHKNLSGAYFKAGDPERVKVLFTLYYTYLRFRDANCLVWLNLIIEESKSGLKMSKRGATTSPLYLLFTIYKDLYGIDDLKFESYQKYYSHNKSNIIFYYMSTVYLAYKQIGDNISISVSEAHKLPLEILLTGSYRFEVDLMAIYNGMNKSSLSTNQITEYRQYEKLVENEDMTLRIPWAYQIYMELL